MSSSAGESARLFRGGLQFFDLEPSVGVGVRVSMGLSSVSETIAVKGEFKGEPLCDGSEAQDGEGKSRYGVFVEASEVSSKSSAKVFGGAEVA